MEKFTLQHIVLYTKGWYKSYNLKSTKRKTIWDDLKILIEADDYLGFNEGDNIEQTKHRISQLLINQLQRIPLTGNERTLSDFYSAIQPQNCWKYWGYDTKQNPHSWAINKEELPDWDIREATVRYCLSCFSRLDNTQWDRVPPDKNVLPFANSVRLKEIKEMFH